MKIIFLFIFLLLNSCTAKQSQIYICGDHPCVDKNEMRDYFKNNISIEVYTVTSEQEKKQSLDLVELNLLKEDLNKRNKINNSLSKKENQKKLKKILDERKKLTKLNVKEQEPKKTTPKKITELKKTSKPKKKSSVRFVRLCKNVEECDIDKISKIIMDMGREKPFPDISKK